MGSKQELPDYDPHLLEKQIAVAKEMHRRGIYTDEELQRIIDRVHDEDHERRAQFIAAGYEKFNIPQLEQEFHETMARKRRMKLSKNRRWLHGCNLEPPENLFDLVSHWSSDPEKERAKVRKQATADVAHVQDYAGQKIEWLWPGRLPLGMVSLLTGDASEGKSLLAGDLMARITTGSDWPDGTSSGEPADVLMIAPDGRLSDVVFPRLEAAGADLSRLQVLSRVAWNDKSGEPDGDAFQLPTDGLILEGILEKHPALRLIVIDPLSDFLALPAAPAERDIALHDVLLDLEELAQIHEFTVLCVDTARRGGIIGTAAGRQWRAHYDPTFMTVWGVARDPRDSERRLFLPIRHELGDDRSGFWFNIEPCELGTARIAWGETEDSVTYAEATGRVRLGRSIWSFSQTADAEAWLREYLKGGEKRSVEIFSDAREMGFTENPVRNALRRVATKNKQGFAGGWNWKLKET